MKFSITANESIITQYLSFSTNIVAVQMVPPAHFLLTPVIYLHFSEWQKIFCR